MSQTNEIIKIIENGSFSDFISEEEKKEKFNTHNYRSWLNQLSVALGSDNIKCRVNCSDVIRAINVFCSKITLRNDNAVNTYLKAILALSEYFTFTKNLEAKACLQRFMTISETPLLNISGTTQLNLYWKYLNSIFSFEIIYEVQFVQNLLKSIIELIKSHEEQYFLSKYVEVFLNQIYYYISAINRILPDKSILLNYLKNLFVALEKCCIKASEISCNSYGKLLSLLFIHTEISIERKINLSNSMILVKNISNIIKDVDQESLIILTAFHKYLANSNSADNLLQLLTESKKKNQFSDKVIQYLSDVFIIYIYSFSKTNIETIVNDHTFSILKIIRKHNSIESGCPKCNRDTHRYSHVTHAMALYISGLIQEHITISVDELFLFYLKYIEEIQKNWMNKCPQRIKFFRTFVRTFNKTVAIIHNDKKHSAEFISFVQETFLELMKRLRNISLPSESLMDLKSLCLTITNAFKESNELSKACYFNLLGVHFTKNLLGFNIIFAIWHANPEFTDSSYETLTKSTLAKQSNILLEKNDYIKLLLKELKELNDKWPSRMRMRKTLEDLIEVTNDPLTLAKACTFLKSITFDDLKNINNILENLELNYKIFKEFSHDLANYLLGTLYGMKYLALGNDYANEMAKAPSLVNQTPEEPDRDGIKHTDDACDVNPVDNKLNIFQENSFVNNLSKAIEFWNNGMKKLEEFKDNKEFKIYLELALDKMETIIISLGERGSYCYLKYDIVMLAIKIAQYLDKHIITLRCIARLIGSLAFNPEFNEITSRCNLYICELLKSEIIDDAIKLYVYDYMLSYTEYLWYNKEEDKAFIYVVYITEKIKKESITDPLILARMYWVQALLKTFENTSWKSIFFIHSLVYENLQAAVRQKEASKYCYSLKLNIFFDLCIKMGKYSMHIYQTRSANYYLKPPLKLAQTLGLTHRIAEIMCILLRTDIIKQKYIDAQVKVNVLTDVIHHSQISKLSDSGSANKKIMKCVELSPKSGDLTNKLFVPEAYRDGNMLHSQPQKLLALSEIGSPPLRYRTFKLPEFFSHSIDCNCICCYDSSYFGLILTATSLEALLNCYLDNKKVADKYFTLCKKIRMIGESKRAQIIRNSNKYSCFLESDNNYATCVLLHLYDQCLYVARSENYMVFQELINSEKSNINKIASISPEFSQNFMTLLASFQFDRYIKTTKAYVGLPIPEFKLTPEKVNNEQLFKTPACSKIVPKRIPNKTKFKIHEDSLPDLRVPQIQFNLIDCEDKECNVVNKPKSSSHSGVTPVTPATPIDKKYYKYKSASAKKSVKIHEHVTKSLVKSTLHANIEKKVTVNFQESLEDLADIYQTPAPKLKTNLILSEGDLIPSPIDLSDNEEKFVTPMKFAKTPHKYIVTSVKNTKTRTYKNEITPKKDDSSVEEEFMTPLKYNTDFAFDKNLQKTMHKQNLKKSIQPPKDSSGSMDDDVFLPCEDEPVEESEKKMKQNAKFLDDHVFELPKNQNTTKSSKGRIKTNDLVTPCKSSIERGQEIYYTPSENIPTLKSYNRSKSSSVKTTLKVTKTTSGRKVQKENLDIKSQTISCKVGTAIARSKSNENITTVTNEYGIQKLSATVKKRESRRNKLQSEVKSIDPDIIADINTECLSKLTLECKEKLKQNCMENAKEELSNSFGLDVTNDDISILNKNIGSLSILSLDEENSFSDKLLEAPVLQKKVKNTKRKQSTTNATCVVNNNAERLSEVSKDDIIESSIIDQSDTDLKHLTKSAASKNKTSQVKPKPTRPTRSRKTPKNPFIL